MKKNTCPKLPDGRAKHYFNKVAGVFRCTRCGTKSDPVQRWETAAADGGARVHA